MRNRFPQALTCGKISQAKAASAGPIDLRRLAQGALAGSVLYAPPGSEAGSLDGDDLPGPLCGALTHQCGHAGEGARKCSGDPASGAGSTTMALPS